MNCYQAKAGELAKHWYVIDADGMVVGRLAAQIAPILMGKHRPTYTPHIDTGDYVIVTNVDKVVFTGEKWRQKSYQRYSGYPGGQREEAAWKLFRRRPERILQLAISRMMPKNKLGRHMLDKLKLYVGPNHPHQAQQPIPLEPLSGRPTPAGAVLVPEPAAKTNGQALALAPAAEAPSAAEAPAVAEAPAAAEAPPVASAAAPVEPTSAAPEPTAPEPALPAPAAEPALEPPAEHTNSDSSNEPGEAQHPE
jgi:large subunit ribosomal protein L13